MEQRKLPLGTIALSVAMLASYFALSSETAYITEANLDQLALNPQNPISVVTHLFIHVGIFHLLGNLLPLMAFAFVLEMVLLSWDIVAIFLISGTISSLLFALGNPGVPLIGASAGISGLLSATVLTKPKAALVLLVLTPILIQAVLFPGAQFATLAYQSSLEESRQELGEELVQAVELNKTPEIITQINRTLVQTEEKIEITSVGKEREEKTPTDFMVHLYGAITGAFYVYFLKRKSLKEGEQEFVEIGGGIFKAIDWLGSKLGRRNR